MTELTLGEKLFLLKWCVKRTLDFEDIVLVETIDFNNGARRIGWGTPEFLLGFIDKRTESIHVSHIDHDANSIFQRGSLGLKSSY